MNIAYAFRRSTFYPYNGDLRGLPEAPARGRFLRRVKDIGFDGIELGTDTLGGADALKTDVVEIREELEDNGVPCVAVRAGGGFHDPRVAADNRRALEKAVDVADWVGAGIVNTTVGTPPRFPNAPGVTAGESTSQGASRTATEDDFLRTSRVLREVGDLAGAKGIAITVEVHQHSIADNSWSTLHLLELAGTPHVLANPDLGNIYWCYDVPEETSEQAILALAPQSKYWHCKNLHRVHHPENERAVFIRVPLPDGDIDYRFAMSAMLEAGFDGYLAVEGATLGDQLHADRRSFEYVKRVLEEARVDIDADSSRPLS